MTNVISFVSLCRTCNKTYQGDVKFCMKCGSELQNYSVDQVKALRDKVNNCIEFKLEYY